MPSTPEVTVIIPTRNRWPLLSTTLRGALQQEQVDHEVIVVDDGSTDETRSQLERLEEPRLRVIRHAAHHGVARARNEGIEAARGEWLAFLDDDDLWAPRKLRIQLDMASSRPGAFVYGAALILDESNAPIASVPPPDPEEVAQLLRQRQVLPAGSSNVMASTSLVRSLGGFDEKLGQLADWDLWIRLSSAAPAAACPEVLVAYRRHDQNMLLTNTSGVIRELEYLVDKHRGATEGKGVKIDRVEVARWVAWGHRRVGRSREAARIYLYSGIAYRDVGTLALAGRMLLGTRMRFRRRPALERPAEPPWLDLYR